MPLYTIDAPNGKTYEVEAPAGAAEQDIFQFVAQQHPESLQLAKAAAPGSIVESLKNFGSSALEFVGRPGELVSGTVAGALAGDPSRGLRAFTEPLVGGKQEESFRKVIQEQAPAFAAAHPWVTAGAGFLGDVVTDPLALATGGAGIIRRPLMAAATAAGVAKPARIALGLPIGEAFQRTVVPAVAEMGLRAAKTIAPSKMAHAIDMKLAKGAAGISAADTKYLSEAQRRAIESDLMGKFAAIVKKQQLTPQDLKILSTARALPHSADAAAVAADPRLSTALADVGDYLDSLRTAEIASGVQQATRPLDELDATLAEALAKVTPAEQRVLKQALTTNARGEVDPANIQALPASLQTLAKDLVYGVSRVEKGVPGRTYFADLGTLDWATQGGKVVPTVSTRLPNYVPQAVAKDLSQTDTLLSSLRARPDLSAAEQRTRTWTEAVAAGTPTDLGEIVRKRARDSAQARAGQWQLDEYAKNFGVTAPTIGYRPLAVGRLKELPDSLQKAYKNLHLPDAVADDIEKVALRLSNPSEMEGFVARSLKVWKTAVTTLNLPAFPAVNFTGNVATMYASGIPPTAVLTGYLRAGLALVGKRKLPQVSVNGQPTDVIELARSLGVLSESTGLAGEMRAAPKLTPMAQAVTTGRFNPLNPEMAGYEKLRAVNQRAIENPARLATFNWHLTQGKTPQQAALEVKKALFDYSDLNDFEKRYLRHAIPFYTWTRNNIPLQLATLVGRPQRMANQQRLLDSLSSLVDAEEGAPLDTRNLPSYLKTVGMMQIPGMTTARGDRVLAQSRLPMTDLNLLTGGPGKIAERAAFLLNPAIRIPLEAAVLGHRVGSTAPLGPKLVPANALGKLTGIGVVDTRKGPMQQASTKYWLDQIPIPLSAPSRTLASQLGEETPSTLPPVGEALLRSVGMSPVVVNKAVRRRGRDERVATKKETRRDLRDERRYQALASRQEAPPLSALASELPRASGVPEDLFQRLIAAESAGDPTAISPVGAVGLTQVMPTTAMDPGLRGTVNIFSLAKSMGIPLPDVRGQKAQATELLLNPALNLAFGHQFISALLDRYQGDPRRALAAYNWGMGHVDKWDGRPETLPDETRNYLDRILG